MDATRFRVLGAMQIIHAGRACPLPSSAERALLVQLLLAPGRMVPATMLIDRLWSGNAVPVDPVNALQNRVSKLRRSLAAAGLADLVTRDGIGYRVDVDPGAVDAVDFELRIRAARDGSDSPLEDRLAAYDAALSLWHGEPLVEFTDEPWALTERARLRQLWLAALGERAALALSLHREAEVIADLQPVVAAEPAHEPLVSQLMVALYRSGQQAVALEIFARTRTYLVEELGLEPSEPLRATHELVLRQDLSLLTPRRVGEPGAPRSSATNLPTVERPLVGREEELTQLVELVRRSRLVTLIGPGGAGKTSMALVTAIRSALDFPDGVFGVRLASVDNPERVPVAVADALHVPVDGSPGAGDATSRLLSFLGTKKILLLMDNCEHVVDAAAELADELWGRCPSVTVLATSREALALPQEIQVPVGPLPVPPAATSADEVLAYPAAEMFVQRARAVRPGLVLEDRDLLDAAEIVRALDGIPLAIELAVARVVSMSTAEVRARLGHRFTLLTSGPRTAEARQRTLRATVDWSYALLDSAEQRAFARLSVCRGGWTLDTAAAVLGDDASEGEVLDVLARLVEQSIVTVDPGTPSRYRMLETLREYAAERLADGGEGHQVRRRHAEHFHDLARRFEVEVRGTGQREALRTAGIELPNMLMALDWLTGDGDDMDSALELAAALALFWQLRRPIEGRDLLERLVADERGSPLPRARALQALSIVERPRASLVHPSPTCAARAHESLAVFEAAGDRSRAALSKVLLAVEGVTGADPVHYSRLLDEADAEFVGAEEQWGRAYVAYVRMETALRVGVPDSALQLGNAAASAFRGIDDQWGLSGVLQHLGRGLRDFGRYEEADTFLHEAYIAAEAAGKYATVPWVLAELGILRVFQDRVDEAEHMFAQATAASLRVGDGTGEVLAAYGGGLVSQLRESWPEARRRYSAAIEGFRSLATPEMEAFALCARAQCEEAVGEVEQADLDYQAALVLGRSSVEAGVIASALEGLARSARRQGRTDRADELAGEAAELRIRSRRPPQPHEPQDAIADVR